MSISKQELTRMTKQELEAIKADIKRFEISIPEAEASKYLQSKLMEQVIEAHAARIVLVAEVERLQAETEKIKKAWKDDIVRCVMDGKNDE